MSAALTPAQRAYYLDGFLAALRRYRRATIAGWAVTAAGVLALPLGWSGGTPHGILDIAVSCAAAVGGIMLVEQSVGMLQAYCTVPFHEAGPPEAPLSPAAEELRALMDEVDRGGWQEAFAAIARLEQIREQQTAETP